MRILLVEDSKFNAAFLARLLREWGEVRVAANGLEARELAAQQRPDVIVSDVLMPKMDGFQMCRELKADAGLRDVPVIFYSMHYVAPQDREFALSLGAVDYLLMPAHPGEFLPVLQQALHELRLGPMTQSPPPLAELAFARRYSERVNARLTDTVAQLSDAVGSLEAANCHLVTMLDVSNAVHTEPGLGDVLYAVNEILACSLGVTSCAILLLNVTGDELNIVGEYGNLIEQLLDIFIRVDEDTVAARALREKQPLQVAAVMGDTTYKPMFATTDIKSALAVPLWHHEQVIGVMLITESRQARAFSDKEVTRAQAIANQAALTIQNALLFHEIRDKNAQFQQTIEQMRQQAVMRSAELELQFKKIEKGKQEWESTFDAIADRIVILSPDHRIIRANRASIGGLDCTFEQLLGRSCCMADAQGNPLPACPVTQALACGGAATAEALDERGRLWQLSAYPVYDKKGKLASLVEVGKDVTAARAAEGEIRRANEELQRLNAELTESHRRLQELDRLKDDFIAVLSHELRTPLTAIIGFNDLMREGIEGELPQAYCEYADIIARRAGELLELISTILQFSQLTARKVSFKTTPLFVPALLAQAAEGARPNASGKGIEVHVEVDAGLPLVLADARAVRQVLDALTSNAVKFTPGGGRVTLAAREEPDGALRVQVSDTGIGIAPEHFETIFDRFRQLQPHETRDHGGIGLGLALAKRLVELQGGRIWVESGPGQGSTFAFTLPAAPAGALVAVAG